MRCPQGAARLASPAARSVGAVEVNMASNFASSWTSSSSSLGPRMAIAAVATLLVGCGGTQTSSKQMAAAQGASAAAEREERRRIAMRDDCDPTDPAWAPTGGCALESGDVNVNEFNALLVSPLSLSTVGHPAWRAEPSYLKLEPGETVVVTNTGGRTHTFTEVAQFGGGRVPPLNKGLTPAPECAAAANLPAGASLKVQGLAAGNHRFQCCIHPWMRALIKVKPEDD
jgi:plastocyanin